MEETSDMGKTNDKFTDMGEAMRCHVSYVLYGIMNNEETYDL